MISVVTEKKPTHTSEKVIYSDASPQWLFNSLHARGSANMRAFAAAGLLRAVMDAPLDERDSPNYQAGFTWATELLLYTKETSKPLPRDTYRMDSYVASLPSVNAKLDSVTLGATKTNNAAAFAALIESQHGMLPNKLLIALGHGGLIVGRDTFLEMNGKNLFYPVRYSRTKHQDTRLRLGARETKYLARVAREKSVVVVDEDTATGETIETAIAELQDALKTDLVIGATPVIAKDFDQFDPQIVSTDSSFLVNKG